ncbi:MAG TPA: substrate-binding domain-containing protein [Opitutus sp.]|nr:substrate-binding domain-containing protein [Opitutus sp.]
MRRAVQIAAMIGCGLAAVAAGRAAEAAPKIGVLLKGTSAFWSAVAEGCRDAAQAAGAEIEVKQPVSESDIAVQIRQLNELAADGIQALVIAPCSSTALAGPVAAVAAKGVKIVVIDSPLDLDMPAYIATNHTDAGMAAGRLLGSLVHDDDEVAILRHSRTGGATLLRESSGYAAIFAAHPGHIVVHRDIYSGTVSGKEEKQALLLLQKYPAITGVLASGTPGTMAMLQALQETGRAGSIRFVGFGFNLNRKVAAALESGAMSGWIAQLPGDVGGRGVKAALALLHGDHVPEVTFCDFLVITKDNLHDPSVQALLPRENATP